MIRAAKSDTVTVRYTGRLSDGTVFDQSPAERPLKFIIGQQEVIAGFDEAVLGMYRGESKTVSIPCDKAYGRNKPELIETIERSLLGNEIEPKVGTQLEVTRQDGSTFYVMVDAVNESEVTLNGNHPLADKELLFDIELIEVVKQQG
jgi:peptidylprolyl isomerase